MDKLTSLFATIGEFLNNTRWYHLVQWPFWTLLVILAFCGVYTARFGKGKLLCHGVHSALRLMLVYIAVSLLYYKFPGFLSDFTPFPLLSYSEEALALVNPIDLLKNWSSDLLQLSLRLFFLLFCINLFDALFDYTPANFLTWLGFQVLYCCGGIGVNAVISYGYRKICPDTIDLRNWIIIAVLLVIYAYLLIGKFIFTFVKKDGDAFFQNAYRIFTTNKYVKQLTISGLALLAMFGYAVIAAIFGHSRMEFSSFNYIAYFLNSFMCAGTLYIFSHYYAK